MNIDQAINIILRQIIIWGIFAILFTWLIHEANPAYTLYAVLGSIFGFFAVLIGDKNVRAPWTVFFRYIRNKYRNISIFSKIDVNKEDWEPKNDESWGPKKK